MKEKKLPNNKLKYLPVALCIVALSQYRLYGFTGDAAGGVGNGQALPSIFAAMRASSNGNLYLAKHSVNSALMQVRYSNSTQQVTLLKLLRKSKRALNVPTLNYQDQKIVVMDFLSQAASILVQEKNVPGIRKTQLQTAIGHLRIGRILGKSGFSGKAKSELVQGKFHLMKFPHAPVIQQAVAKIQWAQYMLGNPSNPNGGFQAQQLITQAIGQIRSSRVFQNGGRF